MSQYEVSTLKKGLLILNALQQEGSMTLSEVMTMFALNKSTTFRLLYTLELMGYVRKVNNLYSVTSKIGIKPNPYHSRLNWLSVPPLYQLSTEIGETAYVGILRGTDVVTAQVVDGTTHSLTPNSNVGETAPVHLSALGKAIVSFLETTEREKIIRELKLVQSTKHTFADSHSLNEHLKIIRQKGYAIDDEESKIGLRCVAVPILYQDHVIASIAIAGPSVRLTKKLDSNLSKKLIHCSRQISKLLK
ncbi:MAG: IclR family transcriptional regulator [Bacillus sp. (in: firmicutes)]